MNETVKQKIDRVIALSDRLTDALRIDITALEQGRTSNLRTGDPLVQQLTLLYGREAGAINANAVKAASQELRSKLALATKRFNDTLSLHQRVLTRMRNASEGVIRAVAQEVERRRGMQRTYARVPASRPRPAGAMLYNSVI